MLKGAAISVLKRVHSLFFTTGTSRLASLSRVINKLAHNPQTIDDCDCVSVRSGNAYMGHAMTDNWKSSLNFHSSKLVHPVWTLPIKPSVSSKSLTVTHPNQLMLLTWRENWKPHVNQVWHLQFPFRKTWKRNLISMSSFQNFFLKLFRFCDLLCFQTLKLNKYVKENVLLSL